MRVSFRMLRKDSTKHLVHPNNNSGLWIKLTTSFFQTTKLTQWVGIEESFFLPSACPFSRH